MRFPKRWSSDRRGTQRVAAHDTPLRVLRWGPTTALVVLVVVCGGVAAMWLLGVWSVPKAPTDADRLRLDRIKTALTVAAGLAAGVTLLLTLRRQMLSERGQRFAESDALEQRTTALYVAAAEQLGSDKAAVRLAGLYALERLGQDNPKLRQTVVDVWCAYLRMPYVPPVEVLKRGNKSSPDRPPDDQEAPNPELEGERRQELQVRLTAQRLLEAHTSGDLAAADEATYWFDHRNKRMVVDLVDAVLIDFSLKSCAVDRFNLSGAQFYGVANLTGTRSYGDADLNGAQFYGGAYLKGAQFHGIANLSGAQFHGATDLSEAQFHSDAHLIGAQFHSDAVLRGTQFHNLAYLNWVQFHGIASLSKSQFHDFADLKKARFHGYANFSGAQFCDLTNMSEAQFYGDANMDGVQFYGDVRLREAQFHRGIDLARPQFDSQVNLTNASVSPTTVLPKGWKLSGDSGPKQGLLLVVRVADAVGEET